MAPVKLYCIRELDIKSKQRLDCFVAHGGTNDYGKNILYQAKKL